MTNKELRDYLSTYPDDFQVVIDPGVESGGYNPIDDDRIEIDQAIHNTEPTLEMGYWGYTELVPCPGDPQTNHSKCHVMLGLDMDNPVKCHPVIVLKRDDNQ